MFKITVPPALECANMKVNNYHDCENFDRSKIDKTANTLHVEKRNTIICVPYRFSILSTFNYKILVYSFVKGHFNLS